MENSLLNKIVNNDSPVEIEQAKTYLEKKMKDGVGIVEALEQAFWFKIVDGKFQAMPDVKPNQLNASSWLAVRAFNMDKEIRLNREGSQFAIIIISEGSETVDYLETHWLLSGEKKMVDNGNQYMSEFQVNAYWMPETAGNAAPRIIVRQYIDYETDTGIAKIVAERFIGLEEEK